jgi:hypothetical protein
VNATINEKKEDGGGFQLKGDEEEEGDYELDDFDD